MQQAHHVTRLPGRGKVTHALIPFVLALTVLAGPAATARAEEEPSATEIPIEMDRRVELIGIVFRLAGNWEYRQCRIPSYAADIDQYFGDFAHHPVVELAAELRNTRRMSCDAPMSLALRLDRDLRPLQSFDQWPWGIDGRWKKDETKEFLAKLRDFAAETKCDAFFQGHQPLYDKGIASCRAVMAQHDLAAWFDGFFGIAKGDDLRMILGFNNGCSNYGLRVADGAKLRKYAIVGMEFCDPQGDPVFDPRLLVLAAHEFCHSFANPVVNEFMDQLQPGAERLYAAHASAMRDIGYQSWQSVMYESAVRACVASFVRSSLEPEQPGLYRLYLKREARSGFVWIEEMDALLQSYEANRDRYPTFASFFPQIVTFLNAYAETST